MMRLEPWRVLVCLAAIAFVVSSCQGPVATSSKGGIVVAGLSTPKSTLLAEIYGHALAHDGYAITYKLLSGTRDSMAPSIESGQIDLYPGYAATDLEYYDKGAGKASSDAIATTANLNSQIQPLGLVALTPSPAADQFGFAVTNATQARYNLATLSDLAPIAGRLTLGTGSDCTTSPACIPGLKKTYGISFGSFKSLDADGPLTRAAFKDGSIDVGLVLSSDGDLSSLGLVVLQDDKHLEDAGNVVPILRQAAANNEVTRVLDAIDAHLTTADLATMNSQVQVQNQDPDAVAAAWLQQHNFWS